MNAQEIQTKLDELIPLRDGAVKRQQTINAEVSKLSGQCEKLEKELKKLTTRTVTKERMLAFMMDDLDTENDGYHIGTCIKAIYYSQSQEERREGAALQVDGVGFSKVDAEFLGSLAQYYKRTGCLTPRQVVAARKPMAKYAGQLIKLLEWELEQYRKDIDRWQTELMKEKEEYNVMAEGTALLFNFIDDFIPDTCITF